MLQSEIQRANSLGRRYMNALRQYENFGRSTRDLPRNHPNVKRQYHNLYRRERNANRAYKQYLLELSLRYIGNTRGNLFRIFDMIVRERRRHQAATTLQKIWRGRKTRLNIRYPNPHTNLGRRILLRNFKKTVNK
jgi:hypothetical protein